MVMFWHYCLDILSEWGMQKLLRPWLHGRRFDWHFLRGWRSIVIEGHGASLIRKLQRSNPDFSLIGPVVMDIRELASSFYFCSFQFVKRACNAAAHYLAQIAHSSIEGGHDVPPAVYSLGHIDNTSE
ncbi:UNVERIFIED_CONTAM: hypothetical protein Sradi_6185500 [Sesamum radiatum]|uniref:RNase H type-1 domain-containing protein n=1 Tax=Sesamum radiatum TaxID=300843 RepID=A0AAW2K9V5_SESRA